MPSSHRPPPDHSAALAQYRRRAGVYDIELALFEPVRQRAVERLALNTGDVVFDVGCGTGLSLPLLQPLIGAKGRIVGIEQSPEMMQLARERVARHGWNNVELIEAPVEAARVKAHADAALFHFTHDILREPLAIDNVLRHLRPGARVVASGLQWAPFWAWPVNLFVLGAARYSVTSLAGLGSPWSLLAKHLSNLQVEKVMAGGVFIAGGVLRHPFQRTTRTSGDPP
ncbi:MAG: class I SAM-dependent methyltransferase [Burkholderiales bacterium]|nr:class I SAM-dependent methyltransferase [Burkholderiales bacterium]